jgi:hypothetical protein
MKIFDYNEKKFLTLAGMVYGAILLAIVNLDQLEKVLNLSN